MPRRVRRRVARAVATTATMETRDERPRHHTQAYLRWGSAVQHSIDTRAIPCHVFCCPAGRPQRAAPSSTNRATNRHQHQPSTKAAKTQAPSRPEAMKTVAPLAGIAGQCRLCVAERSRRSPGRPHLCVKGVEQDQLPPAGAWCTTGHPVEVVAPVGR